MRAILEELPEAGRVDEIVAMLGRLRRGEVLTLVCPEDPEALAEEVRAKAPGYDRQAIHVARKKSEPWLLHFKRQHRP